MLRLNVSLNWKKHISTGFTKIASRWGCSCSGLRRWGDLEPARVEGPLHCFPTSCFSTRETLRGWVWVLGQRPGFGFWRKAEKIVSGTPVDGPIFGGFHPGGGSSSTLGGWGGTPWGLGARGQETRVAGFKRRLAPASGIVPRVVFVRLLPASWGQRNRGVLLPIISPLAQMVVACPRRCFRICFPFFLVTLRSILLGGFFLPSPRPLVL